jgi:hypothetical protein
MRTFKTVALSHCRTFKTATVAGLRQTAFLRRRRANAHHNQPYMSGTASGLVQQGHDRALALAPLYRDQARNFVSRLTLHFSNAPLGATKVWWCAFQLR